MTGAPAASSTYFALDHDFALDHHRRRVWNEHDVRSAVRASIAWPVVSVSLPRSPVLAIGKRRRHHVGRRRARGGPQLRLTASRVHTSRAEGRATCDGHSTAHRASRRACLPTPFGTTIRLPRWSCLNGFLPRYRGSSRCRSPRTLALLPHRVFRHCHQDHDAENESAHGNPHYLSGRLAGLLQAYSCRRI